ncbi:MAG: hypothetical protein MR936_05530 [Eubacterium sp.]|nr:hypothetical protein [Eubacterium sp.]
MVSILSVLLLYWLVINDEGSYDMKLLGKNMNPEAKLFKLAENHGVMVMISIFAALLGIASLANGITLGVKTIK